MRFLTVFVSALLILCGLTAAAYMQGGIFGFHWWAWHQKLTVTVDTPNGLKTGSSVTRVSVSASPRWWGVGDAACAGGSSLSGEAVTVDLGEGRYLFALLKDYSHETARRTFIPKNEQPKTEAQVVAVYDRLETTRESRELPSNQYPLLVTFGDINNPASVRRVEPGNLAATFGDGYRLNAITLSITDEPVTKGEVKKLLPWLRDFYSTRFDGQRFGTIKKNNPFANSLASGAFDTEKNK